METVQLQCGNCKQLMAIGVEHLGSQVQCPHCRSVVQTPPRTPAAPVPSPAGQNLESNQRESIFTGAEPSDDLFGGGAKLRVEMPAEAAPPPMYQAPAPPVPMEAGSDGDLSQFKRRPIYDKGVVQMSVLIFLVPYSIMTTLIIVYLLFFHGVSRDGGDPLRYLPDPASSPKKGGPQPVSLQPSHDSPLSAGLRTTLKTPLTIGDLTVTPEKVVLTSEGDLQLFFRARNDSKDSKDSKKAKFEPVHDSWVIYAASKAGNEPYTFLESKSKSFSNIYGGYLEYRKNFKGGKEAPDTYVIGPREEAFMVLTTRETYRTPVAGLAKSTDELLWRLRVRRGLVRKNGNFVSATAVIGVEFSVSDIEKEKQS